MPLETALTLESTRSSRRPGARPLARIGAVVGRLRRDPLVAAFLRFLGVGVVGLAVDAALFSALDRLQLAPEISRALSLALATGVTWWLNRRHTFGASGRRPAVEAMRYGLVTLVAQGFSYGVFLALVYEMPALPRLFSLLVGAGLAAFVGFAGHKLFAFAPARPRGEA